MEEKKEEKNSCELLYNTQRKSLKLPEYGRNVQKMVEYLRSIEDRERRNQQAYAVTKVMETINPQVHLQENYEQKLWDHLFIIADFDLDVDYPFGEKPRKEEFNSGLRPVEYNDRLPKILHYGKNVEKFIDMIADKEDGDEKTYLIRSIAFYMKQQYLQWNKDVVSDETIFSDIVMLSGGRIQIPEGLAIGRPQQERQNFSNSRQGSHYQNPRFQRRRGK